MKRFDEFTEPLRDSERLEKKFFRIRDRPFPAEGDGEKEDGCLISGPESEATTGKYQMTGCPEADPSTSLFENGEVLIVRDGRRLNFNDHQSGSEAGSARLATLLPLKQYGARQLPRSSISRPSAFARRSAVNQKWRDLSQRSVP